MFKNKISIESFALRKGQASRFYFLFNSWFITKCRSVSKDFHSFAVFVPTPAIKSVSCLICGRPLLILNLGCHSLMMLEFHPSFANHAKCTTLSHLSAVIATFTYLTSTFHLLYISFSDIYHDSLCN